ncbi:MarR-like DNA-binding transcriptional regulator SgrR of sgrS sRNA [Bacillus sp. SORGH_AS 510]|uniref:ABC transporter substrate-binding protein n=1 Tax=Bacillus sp. SORGH_AS_0510 TaxID=3041771 RepID=UPI00277F6E1F|nr:ABC transporter substrate-binding protein [Bacillus sp. SORGH_AS_0510]MDQ1143976.1 MarR-like DNA-binding transcriptional regulator SgrR of sgrS sRNA [Bacillus sp. SORGH_AS_0510]
MNERYFAMRAHFLQREVNGECTFKLNELEELWFCSLQNVKRILHQFEESCKISYLPGVGRGNPSRLRFSEPFQREVEEFMKDCMENGQLDQAAQLLRLPIPKSWIAKVSADIQEMFGYHQGTESKDVLHAFISRDITTLDPLKVSISFESHLIEYLGDTLVKYEAANDRILPHIAHHFESSEDGTKWTFYLRKGIVFHHHEPLTSKDVAYTVERMKHSTDSSYQWLARDIESVECSGPYKVTILLKKKNPFFLRYIASPNFCILPANLPFNEGEWIGTGPFLLKERSRNKVVLEAFDRYFLERPLLDELHFYKVTEEAAAVVDFTLENPPSEETLSKHEIETGFRFMMCNLKRETIVQHPSFRKALYHLMDVNLLAKDLGWEQWIEASSFINQRSFPQSKDPKEIFPLLEEAGYTGEPIQLYHMDYQKAFVVAEWYRKQGEQYGINFVLQKFTFDDFYRREMDKNADLVFIGEVSSLDPHLSFLGAFYNDTLLFRRMFPLDSLEWIDAKLEEFKQVDAVIREAIMVEIEAHIRENNLLIFQHHPIKTRTFHPMIKDVKFHSFGHFDFSRLWIPN